MTAAAPIVLLAHGSPDDRHRQGVEHLAGQVRGRAPHRAVHTAYLQHHAPGPTEAARRTPAGCAVVPVLLTPAYHARVDVPEAVAAMRACTGGEHRAAPALGPDGMLLRACEQLLGRSGVTPDPRTGVILYAAGSSDGAAAATIRQTLAVPGPSPGWGTWKVAALDGAAELGDVVRDVQADASVHRTVVVPFMVAGGVLRDRMAQQAWELGLDLVPGALSDTPALAELVLLRADTLQR